MIKPYSKQNINNEDISTVIKVLKSDFITQGKKISEFEDAIKKYVGCKYAVALSSASAGLHLAVKSLGLNSKKLSITSPITFCSTINSVLHCGGDVMFSDIDYFTGNISISNLKAKLKSKRIKIILPVHFGGLAPDMKEIQKLVKKKNIYIIEDAAHSLGANYKDGSKVGSCKYSDMTVFSFHPVKTITTGEGGVVTTNSKATYDKLINLRSHGIEKQSKKFINKKYKKLPWYYEVQSLSHHYRITDFQCALGISQLSRINFFIKRRKEIAKRYDKAFKNSKSFAPLQFELRDNSSNHLYVLLINFSKIKKNKIQIVKDLKKKGIGTQVHYIPLFLHPLYKKKIKTSNIDLKNSLNYYHDALSIPIYPDLKKKEQEKIIKIIKKTIN